MKVRVFNELVQAERDGYFVVARDNSVALLSLDPGVAHWACSSGALTDNIFTSLASLSADGYLSYTITRNR